MTTTNNETNNDEIRYTIQLSFHLLLIHVTILLDSSVDSQVPRFRSPPPSFQVGRDGYAGLSYLLAPPATLLASH
jgi:hypothetical protein